jgi:serine/threonine protein kinase
MVTELEPGMLVGRYRLVEEMARGGMGTVWAARDTRLERDVAVKVLPRLLVTDPSAERRFEREARAMGRLQHPNVVTVFDVGSADPGTGEELPFLVMELVRATSLNNLMANDTLAADRVVRIFEQVATALSVAHDAGVVHRDLKPSNIMVGEEDRVSVLDFGLARLAQQEGGQPEDTLTTPGMVLGSCPYMAPEQALGQEVGPASDVFSCGAVMYESLTGVRAFDGATPMRVLQAVVKCEYTPLAEVAPNAPTELVRIVEKCLEKDLSRRYASADELRRDLAAERAREESASAPTASGDDTSTEVARSGAPHAGPLVVGLVLLAFLIGLALGWWLGRGDRSRPVSPTSSGLARSNWIGCAGHL